MDWFDNITRSRECMTPCLVHVFVIHSYFHLPRCMMELDHGDSGKDDWFFGLSLEYEFDNLEYSHIWMASTIGVHFMTDEDELHQEEEMVC